MKLSDVIDKFDVELVSDGYFEDMNYCTSELQVPFLSFMEKEKFISKMNPNVTCIICREELVDKLVDRVQGIVISREPKYLFHQLYNEYSKKIEKKNKDTIIGCACEISECAKIAAKNVIIGDRVVIEPFVVINEGVTIGNDCIIHSNVVLGARSFSFARASSGEMCGLSDNGRVIIQNSVEIYPFTHIAQGIWSDDITFIGENTKIDAQCYIAHGVQIGKSTLIASNVVIGGNTSIGNRTWIGLNAAIANRITIGNDARVNMGAVVTKNVEDGAEVSGNFAINHERFINFVKYTMNK